MSYVEDIRALKRMKSESKASWLIWRRGKYSPNEIDAIRSGLEGWVAKVCEEENISREEALESLKWAKENKMTAWCDIATRSSLPERKIGSIRHCVLRRMLSGSELSKWSKEETAEFVRLQGLYGPRAWKQIAKDTGRTLEDVTNKGRQMEQVVASTRARFRGAETLREKLAQWVRQGQTTDPYEYGALLPDCELAAYARRYMCPEGELRSIHGIPAFKFCEKLNSGPLQVRHRWHQVIMRGIIQRATSILDDEELMNSYLALQARKACKGTLVDIEGNGIFPAYDWNGLPWSALMPLWPQGFTESKLQNFLRREAKFGRLPLPDVIDSVVESILTKRSKQEIKIAAKNHFAEIARLFHIVADRGDDFLRKAQQQVMQD